MIVIAAPLVFVGYTLIYAAVANFGALAYAPWLAWEKDASAYALDKPLGPTPRHTQHGTGEQPSAEGGGGPAPQPASAPLTGRYQGGV